MSVPINCQGNRIPMMGLTVSERSTIHRPLPAAHNANHGTLRITGVGEHRRHETTQHGFYGHHNGGYANKD